MSKMTTCLWFDKGEARKAAEFYASVFPDTNVGAAMAAPGDYPGGATNDELTVDFTLLGQSFVGLNGGPNFKPNEAVSFMVVTEDQEETDRYWNAITQNGGEESMCGWCKDRWGYLVADHAPSACSKPIRTPTRRRRSARSQAMMTMNKIDIAKIEAAVRGETTDA